MMSLRKVSLYKEKKIKISIPCDYHRNVGTIGRSGTTNYVRLPHIKPSQFVNAVSESLFITRYTVTLRPFEFNLPTQMVKYFLFLRRPVRD